MAKEAVIRHVEGTKWLGIMSLDVDGFSKSIVDILKTEYDLVHNGKLLIRLQTKDLMPLVLGNITKIINTLTTNGFNKVNEVIMSYSAGDDIVFPVIEQQSTPSP